MAGCLQIITTARRIPNSRGSIQLPGLPCTDCSCQAPCFTATIDVVPNMGASDSLAHNPFQPGTMVVLTLGSPREKFWGAVLTLAPEGISIRGIELASFDDLVSLIKENEPYPLGVVFFPMHRVERMELDLPDGSIPSLGQRFTTRTGLDPAAVLVPNPIRASEEQR